MEVKIHFHRNGFEHRYISFKIEVKFNSEMAYSQIIAASFSSLTASLWHVNQMVLINKVPSTYSQIIQAHYFHFISQIVMRFSMFYGIATQLISESYNNSHNRVKITPQGGVTIFAVNITPKRSNFFL